MSLIALSVIVYSVIVTLLTLGFLVVWKTSGRNRMVLVMYVALESMLTLAFVAWLFFSGAIPGGS